MYSPPRLCPTLLCLLLFGMGCETTEAMGPEADAAPLADVVAEDVAVDPGPPPEDLAEPDGDGHADPPDLTDLHELDDTAEDTPSADLPPPEPPRIALTVAEIPPEMNGSLDSVLAPLSWRLRVNRAHVSLDVLALPESGPIDWSSLAIHCDDGEGETLRTPVEAVSEHHHRHLVDPLAPFSDGRAVTCRAEVDGPGGSASDLLDFDAATLPEDLDPFTTVDRWLITTSRDHFSLQVEAEGGGTARLLPTYLPEGDGVPDLDQALDALGLTSPDHPDTASAIRAHLMRRIREASRRFFALDAPLPPRIDLLFEGTPEAEPWLGMTPDALDAAAISRIAIGGDGGPSDIRDGTFGRARIDWNNQVTDDNTVHGLGVFSSALVRAALAEPLAALLLDRIRPDLGGTPLGADPLDDLFIGRDDPTSGLPPIGDVDDRATLYGLLIDFTSLGLASVLTHEIGHSLGLVPFGPPPEGLFAGVAVDFIADIAPDAHINLPGLNIMQTGGSVDIAAVLRGDEPRFEPLSLAYLRRMLVVGPPR